MDRAAHASPPAGGDAGSTAGTGTGAGETVERLWPAWWIWLVVAMLAASAGLVVARFSGTGAVVTFGASAVVLGSLLIAGTPNVGDRGDRVVDGRAQVPIAFVGRAEPLDARAMRHAVGPGLDARSYLCLRGWVGPGLRLELRDPADPTPSWIVSARRPDRLAAAVEAARPR